MDGRHGMSTRSAARAAASAGDSPCGAVSIKQRAALCLLAVVEDLNEPRSFGRAREYSVLGGRVDYCLRGHE